MNHSSLTGRDLKALYAGIYRKADKIIEPLLGIMFLFGIYIATFYDTWLIAIGVGSLCLFAYLITKKLLPDTNLYQYVLSIIFALFAAQYIYQMHGMAEMHFWVFISSTLLIVYQNWRLQFPLILMVYIHHALFAYLQYAGYKEVYFTRLDYMDLTTFVFHAILATGVCGISAIWGYKTHKRTLQDALNIKTLSDLQEELKQVNENLNTLVAHRTQALLEQNQKIVQHAFINAHKVRSPLARILGLVHLIQYEKQWNENGKELIEHLNISAQELDKILQEVRVNLDKAEFKE